MTHAHTTRPARQTSGRWTRPVRAALLGSGALAIWLTCLALAPAQQMHRNGFETRGLAWQKGAADVLGKRKVLFPVA